MLTLARGELAANLSEKTYLVGVNSWGLTFHITARECTSAHFGSPFLFIVGQISFQHPSREATAVAKRCAARSRCAVPE
jgi:hypothetical protein